MFLTIGEMSSGSSTGKVLVTIGQKRVFVVWQTSTLQCWSDQASTEKSHGRTRAFDVPNRSYDIQIDRTGSGITSNSLKRRHFFPRLRDGSTRRSCRIAHFQKKGGGTWSLCALPDTKMIFHHESPSAHRPSVNGPAVL